MEIKTQKILTFLGVGKGAAELKWNNPNPVIETASETSIKVDGHEIFLNKMPGVIIDRLIVRSPESLLATRVTITQ